MHDGDVITADMLKFFAGSAAAPKAIVDAPIAFNSPQDIRPLAELEQQIIMNAVQTCGGNITEAARRLSINSSTIHRKQKNALANQM